MFRIGDVINNTYRLMEEIGRGGMGVIYKAYHLRLKKYVVLKKIKSSFSGAINDRAEVDLLKKLHHSYLPQVYDFLQFGQEVFTVMEYVDGSSLSDCLKKQCVFKEEELIRWLRELLEVLDYLHSQRPSIYHNDIKPGNIMITRDGHACLIDFNISLDETETDKIIGLSEAYASPEQKEKAKLARMHQYHENIRIDARSDLYSLGVTFLRLTRGGNYSEGLIKVLEKAARVNKNERFKSAKQMLNAVENLSHYDNQYLRYRYIAIAGRALYALLLVLAVLLTYWGYRIQVSERYDGDFQALTRYSTQSSYAEVNEKGTAILNDTRYAGIFKRNPGKKAEILNAVGNACCGNENYNGAIEYYEEAAALSQNAVYMRNCAVAYAKAGDISEAERMLALAEENGAETADIEIIRGEIAYANQDKKAALEAFEKAEKEAVSPETRVEALRRAGKLYYEYKTYQKAADCYEQINQTEMATFEDRMNLAINHELLRKYEKAERVLKSLAEDYPEDYRVYMCLTRIAVKTKQKDKTEMYYDKARDYYKNSQSVKKDQNMEKLIKEMEAS